MFCFAGTSFLCSVIIGGFKNERDEMMLFILNFEDITDAPVKSDSYRNALKNSELNTTLPSGWDGEGWPKQF